MGPEPRDAPVTFPNELLTFFTRKAPRHCTMGRAPFTNSVLFENGSLSSRPEVLAGLVYKLIRYIRLFFACSSLSRLDEMTNKMLRTQQSSRPKSFVWSWDT